MAVSRTLRSAQVTGGEEPRADDRLSRKIAGATPRQNRKFGYDIMPKEGIEPSYPSGYTILSRARLPIPPLRRPERTKYKPLLLIRSR
jgi:hypothetical protein